MGRLLASPRWGARPETLGRAAITLGPDTLAALDQSDRKGKLTISIYNGIKNILFMASQAIIFFVYILCPILLTRMKIMIFLTKPRFSKRSRFAHHSK